MQGFKAVAGQDTSFEFRKVAQGFLKAQGDNAATVGEAIDAALLLTEPTKSNAILGLLSDVVDCESTFAAVESRVMGIAQIVQADQKLKSAVLTWAIDLHRNARLEPQFRGRIIWFLNYVMPALDKSSLNMRGAVASASSSVASNGVDDSLLMEMDHASSLKLDFNLYTSFWRLQQFISAGASIVTKPGQFDGFVSSCEAVLNAVAACSSVAGAASGKKKTATVVSDALGYYRDPEVLLAHFSSEFDETGSFKLPLLIQLAICLSYLEHQSKNERITSVLKDLLKRVFVEMGKINTECPRLVEQLVESDAQWLAWRNDGAKVDALPAVVEVQQAPTRKDGASRQKQSLSHNAELTRLWGLAAVAAPPSVNPPRFSDFVDRVLEEADPENDIADAYRTYHRPLFNWQMQRTGLEQAMSKLNNRSTLKADLLTLARNVKQHDTDAAYVSSAVVEKRGRSDEEGEAANSEAKKAKGTMNGGEKTNEKAEEKEEEKDEDVEQEERDDKVHQEEEATKQQQEEEEEEEEDDVAGSESSKKAKVDPEPEQKAEAAVDEEEKEEEVVEL